MPLDPQAQATLGHRREAGRRPFEHMTFQEARQPAWAFVDLQGSPVPTVSHRFVPGSTAVAVKHQKAPQHEFPVPFNDAWASTCRAARYTDELNIEADRFGGTVAGRCYRQ
jgi:hypothetical protein